MKDVVVNARLNFNPKREGLRKGHRRSEFWVVAEVDMGVHHYYSWWINRYLSKLLIHRPAFGCHVTIVRDKDRVTDAEIFKKLKQRYDGKMIQIRYNPELYKVRGFFCLPVDAHQIFRDIRGSLGLNEDFKYHITVGRDDV